MNDERLLKVLIAPHVSEKTSRIAMGGRSYVFRILKNATKKEVAAAIEKIFSVKVDSVRTCNVRKKQARFGQVAGFHKAWKKAYVTLKAGSQIEIGENQA